MTLFKNNTTRGVQEKIPTLENFYFPALADAPAWVETSLYESGKSKVRLSGTVMGNPIYLLGGYNKAITDMAIASHSSGTDLKFDLTQF